MNLLFVSNLKGIEIDRIVIFDLSGKVVSEHISVGNEFTMDVSDLQSGMYLLEIQSKKGTVQKRIVKQ